MKNLLAFAVLSASSPAAFAATESDLTNFTFPELDSTGQTDISLWATYYYLPQMNASQTGHALVKPDNTAFPVKLAHKDFCVAAMEGSVRIRQASTNTVYNYAGRATSGPDCSDVYSRFPKIGFIRWRKAYGTFGDGADRAEGQPPWILIPFRSIAVDPDVIPFGSLVYIPAARGTRITLPSGKSVAHDGYFIATDRGGGIKDTHIDVYIGTAESNPFKFVKSTQTGTFKAFIAQKSAIQKLLVEASIPE
jgi:3D (Asp-Asp-Asp) domain-containing protein